MRRALTSAALAAAGALMFSGCFLSNTTGGGDDGGDGGDFDGGDADGAPVDPRCRPLGGVQRCGPTCPPCSVDETCSGIPQVCVPFATASDPRGSDFCNFQFSEGSTSAQYCWSNAICATWREQPDGFGGTCLPPEYCTDAREAGLTDIVCRYSDGTTFDAGPPTVDECPPGNPRTTFCGGPCSPDGCPWTIPVTRPGDYAVSCIGLSEERGLGVCALGTRKPCERGLNLDLLPWMSTQLEEPALCLVPREGDELADIGWVTLADACRGYRDLFPDDFDCVDETWTSR